MFTPIGLKRISVFSTSQTNIIKKWFAPTRKIFNSDSFHIFDTENKSETE